MARPLPRTFPLARRTRRALARFVRREDGTSAVEFAIILPLFLLPAWFGFAEIAAMQERTTVLNTTTAMVADMVSQYQQVEQTQLNDIMTTAQYMLGPRTSQSADFTMVVMGVVVPAKVDAGDTQPKPYIGWSMDRIGGSVPCGTPITLPAGVAEPTASDRTVIVADGTLVYDSPFGWDRERSSKTISEGEDGDGNEVTREVSADGWLKVWRQPLKHRSIYAPRLVQNPSGPNPCPKPGDDD